MKCVIPCAGFGTRFASVVPNTPKALVKIGGKSILDRLIGLVESVSVIDEVFIISNGYFLADFDAWLESYHGPKKVRLICDGALSNEKRAGRIHAVKLALQFLKRLGLEDDLLVVYGDNVMDFDLSAFTKKFDSLDASMQVVYDVKSFDEAKHFGVYELDSKGDPVGLVEKPQNPLSTMVGVGVYAIKKRDVPVLYEDYSLDDPVDPGMAHVMMRLMNRGRLKVFPISKWVDIGTRETYERALKEF